MHPSFAQFDEKWSSRGGPGKAFSVLGNYKKFQADEWSNEMEYTKPCPHCGGDVVVYRNPAPTVDVVIHIPGQGVVLIERANPPHGWALPGGFIDYGESCEHAAIREAMEETGLEVRLTRLLGVYSEPDRDPRHHTMSVVYVAEAIDPTTIQAGDDAAEARIYPLGQWPDLAFDHAVILEDFLASI